MEHHDLIVLVVFIVGQIASTTVFVDNVDFAFILDTTDSVLESSAVPAHVFHEVLVKLPFKH